jgi:DNA-directed RNA polymerase subunit RPC12/RpoP
MNTQTRILGLKCASCGADLKISPDMDIFACGHCGTRQLVERRGGTVNLKVISEAVARVQVGTDKTAAELALRRLGEERVSIELGKKLLRQRAVQAEASRNNGLIACLVIGVTLALVIACTGGNVGGVLAIIGFTGIVAAMTHRTNTSQWKTGNQKRTNEAHKLDARMATVMTEINENLATVSNRSA